MFVHIEAKLIRVEGERETVVDSWAYRGRYGEVPTPMLLDYGAGRYELRREDGQSQSFSVNAGQRLVVRWTEWPIDE